MEASGTDLSKFKARGGKLLIYQGLADVIAMPEATRQWYEALTKDMGGDAANHGIRAPVHGPGHGAIAASSPVPASPIAASIRCLPSRSGSRRACRPRASS